MTDFKDGTEPLTDDGALPCQTTEESAQTAPLAETADNTTTEVAQPDGDAVVHFPAPAHTVKDNGWAIAAFVLAFLVAPVGFVLGIVGAVYSRKVDDSRTSTKTTPPQSFLFCADGDTCRNPRSAFPHSPKSGDRSRAALLTEAVFSGILLREDIYICIAKIVVKK